MSQTMQPPATPPQGPQSPPGTIPNPAFGQWMQAYQQQQQVVQANAEKQAQFDAACQLIRKDGVKGFKLEIEADSTIAPDEMAEKQARIEFLQQIVPFMEQITPIAQGNPQMAELASEITMFAVRGFRVARTLEEAFEKAFKVLGQMPPPAPKGGHGPTVDPQLEQAKLAAQMHDTQVKAQTETSVAGMKAQADQAATAQKAQQALMTLQAAQQRAAAEEQHNQATLALEAAKMHSTERLQAARIQSSEARGASGLI